MSNTLNHGRDPDDQTINWSAEARRSLNDVQEAPLSESVLARTFSLEARGQRAILKLYNNTIPQFVRSATDPRVASILRLFPLAPHFSSANHWLRAAGGAVTIEVPELLAEGELSDGRRFVVMEHLTGHPVGDFAQYQPDGRRQLSAAIGKLARELHDTTDPAPATAPSQDSWLDQAAEALHLIADQIATPIHNNEMHVRVHQVVAAARDVPLGEITLVHGDLHPANLLVDEGGRISGLMDFDLSCHGPAALDFRHLAALDEAAFLSSYGRYAGTAEQARWAGDFCDLLWTSIGLLAHRALSTTRQVPAELLHQFSYLLTRCETERPGVDTTHKQPVRPVTSDNPATPSGLRLPSTGACPDQVAILITSWNHCETTTRPCLQTLRWFTDLPYRAIVVDNNSQDSTRDMLAAATADDPRIEVVHADQNLGWAQGTLTGLDHLRDEDTHVLLLNSDVLLTPRWLRKLLEHLPGSRTDTLVIPDEYPPVAGARGPTQPEHPITPGSKLAAPPPPLADVLRLAQLVEQDQPGASAPGHPSGFCLLFHRSRLALVRAYLADFEDYHSGKRDPNALWSEAGLHCLIARDTFVFHARGGSGGYYHYDRQRTL